MNIIITPFYNCAGYIGRCIQSIQKQTEKFHCYLINDLSTDRSLDVVYNLIKRDTRFSLIFNQVKKYQCANYEFIINQYCKDDDIIFTLDGDDKFAHKDVIKYIENVYNIINVWVTYGSYINKSNKSLGLCHPINNFNTLRSDPWCASHLRTFKAGLFKKIIPSDFYDWSNQPLSMAGDLAFMLPMLEMAGPKHSQFIKDIMYIYSDTNQLSDHKVNLEHQLKCAEWIRSKQPYERIQCL